MKNTISSMAIVIMIAGVLLASTTLTAWAQDETAELRPIFVNLTTGIEDLQKCSMALSLAENSMAAGRDVTVFLNVHAIRLAAAGEEITLFNSDELMSDKIAGLIDGGAAIIVCPMCLGNSPYTEDDLIEGVQTAGGDNFFPPIDDGAAVFSY